MKNLTDKQKEFLKVCMIDIVRGTEIVEGEYDIMTLATDSKITRALEATGYKTDKATTRKMTALFIEYFLEADIKTIEKLYYTLPYRIRKEMTTDEWLTIMTIKKD